MLKHAKHVCMYVESRCVRQALFSVKTIKLTASSKNDGYVVQHNCYWVVVEISDVNCHLQNVKLSSWFTAKMIFSTGKLANNCHGKLEGNHYLLKAKNAKTGRTAVPNKGIVLITNAVVKCYQ